MSDSLFYYAHQKALHDRFHDIIKPNPNAGKTPEQVVDDIVKKAGLTVIESEDKDDTI